MNKFIVFILSVLLCSINSFSQELVVKSFRLNEGDLSARTEKRLDANGNQCALIKVEAIPVCEFGGYVIGAVEKKLGAYWVYVCAKNPITKKLIVSSDNFQPIEVNFSEYGISKISPGETYSIRIEAVNKTAVEELNNHNYIDLGLSVHWADRNFGAENINDIGSQIKWGVDVYTLSQAPDSISNISSSKYDILSQLWGGNWRIPTQTEISELESNCLIYNDDEQGVKGKRIIGPNGNSLFFPFESSIGTILWSSFQSYALKIGYYVRCLALFEDESELSVGMRRKGEKHLIRGVISNEKFSTDGQMLGILTNDKYYIRGQIVDDLGRIMTSNVNIYDNETNELIHYLSNEHGLFELWIYKTHSLRFEFADKKETDKCVIKEPKSIMKIHMPFRLFELAIR